MHNCPICKAKAERIEDLKDALVDQRRMADYWWRQTKWWMEYRTGKPARLAKPRHLKIVSSS